MKKLLILCFVLATTFTINAQQKRSNEETINFIEMSLKKFIGKKDNHGNLLTDVSFDGNKLITTQNISSSEERVNLYFQTYSNFNWRNVEFKVYEDNASTLKSKIPGFERLFLRFENPFKYKVNDDEVTEKNTANFYVPTEKVEDIKEAFLSVRKPQQESAKQQTIPGPTKEETLTFIKSYFDNKVMNFECSDKDDMFRYRRVISYSNYNISLEETDLTMEYKWTYKQWTNGKVETEFSEFFKIEVDLSKIELVLVYTGGLHQDCEDKSIIRVEAAFRASPGFKSSESYNKVISKKNVVTIPINAYKCDGCDNEAENKKIIQAFNHLRKLCGAKEEINFGN